MSLFLLPIRISIPDALVGAPTEASESYIRINPYIGIIFCYLMLTKGVVFCYK